MDNYENYGLTDERWKRIQSLLPPEYTGEKGRPRKDNRIMPIMLKISNPPHLLEGCPPTPAKYLNVVYSTGAMSFL